MTTYESYREAALLRRAYAARREDAHIFCMHIGFSNIIITNYGEKYITPAAMSVLLGCNIIELDNAIKQHKAFYKEEVPEFISRDLIPLSWWIDFLSLDCFSDSREAAEAIRLISEEMNR